MSLLEAVDIDVHYGDFQALFGVTLRVDEGETLAVLGANGAGKSTMLKTFAGLLFPTRGSVRFDGAEISRLRAHRRPRLGIALTPEGRRIFPSMTLEENLLMGSQAKRAGPWTLRRVYEVFPFIAERRTRLGAQCSGGELQAAAIGRSLMSNPRLLLLDEISLGLAPVTVKEVYRAIPLITADGTTVLVVEQDVNQALSVADRVQCLLEGRTVLQGSRDAVQRDDIVAAYFGK